MAIRAVCVDRARLVIKEPSTIRVEGRTSFVPVAGQWFRCRLFLSEAADTADSQGGHFEAVSQAQVLAITTDLDGKPLEFHGDQRLDISSRDLGRALWRQAGEAQPLRKRRRVIGWLVNVSRVVEREYDDLLAQNAPHLDVR